MLKSKTRRLIKLFYFFPIIAFGVFFNGLTACSPVRDGNLSKVENLKFTAVPVENDTHSETERINSPLTEKEVRNLVIFWQNAQNAGDFEGYKNCYTKPFKGIKTVSGKSREYDYTEWMDDRRTMLARAVGLDVGVRNLQISINGETATVEFDQYYRSKSYSDWGPKILEVKQTPQGVKIAYELLKASNPL